MKNGNLSRLAAAAAVVALSASTLTACSTASAQTVSLKITNIYGAMWQAPLQAAAKTFEGSNPGTKVTIQELPYDGYQAALQTQFVGGAAPDIALIEPPAVTSFASRGFLEPLTTALDSTVTGGKTWRATFTGDSVSSMKAQDGKDYTIPWSRIHIKALYSPDAFAKVGVSSYPATWDEFIAANKKLLAQGTQPLSSGFAGNDASMWWRLTPMLEALYRPYTQQINLKHAKGWKFNYKDSTSVGGETYTADEKYVAFMNGITDPAKSPEYRKAIELILQLKPFIGDPTAWTPQSPGDLFIAGKLPQRPGQDPEVAQLKASAVASGKTISVAIAEQPTITTKDWAGLTDGGVNPIAAVRNGFVVNAASKNKSRAIEFLKFLTTSKETTAVYTKGTTTDGSYSIQQPSTVADVTYPKASGLVDDSTKTFAQISLFGFGMPPTYDQQDFDEFTSQFQKLFAGSISTDEFLKLRSDSDRAALTRNLAVYASEVDQSFIDKNLKK